MSDVVIRVENLSKEYRLGTISHGTLKHDLQSGWAKLRGTEDPNARIGAVNREQLNNTNERFCALKDVSFDVRQGEIVGIIGRNGAGKSTLLKILSRVTAPTKGSIKIKGNVASLLEVGTGFHPELTGRENVFLNGAILGMSKAEIDDNFNDIIKFSDIEKFIDTPVKRYSSGMYVRLAFAVAAHLDPDILLVDEVLAVGDAGFQKKCLGKMKQVSKSEKTVLFVSHSMGAINSICNRAILLENSQIVRDGDVKEVTQAYSSNFQSDIGEIAWPDMASAPGNNCVRLHSVRILQDGFEGSTSEVDIAKDIIIEIRYWNLDAGSHLSTAITLKDALGSYVLATNSIRNISLTDDDWEDIPRPQGLFISQCILPKGLLNNITYDITVSIVRDKTQSQIYMEDVLQFTAHDTQQTKTNFYVGFIGVVRPRLAWNTKYLSGL